MGTTKQTSPKTTLTGAASFNLNQIDPSNYYNATLTGSFATGRAHSSAISPLLTNLLGDTLVAKGNNTTLYGGAGRDSLVALGNNDCLIAGTGIDTLLGTTIVGGYDTLAGNGASSLMGRGANDTFILNKNGDKISEVAGGNNTILLTTNQVNNFSLTDTAAHGTGIAQINKLVYTGTGGATLSGNNLADTIIGNTLSGGNFISAGGVLGNSLVGGLGSDTLQGNGRSTLNGGAGTDTFYVTSQNGTTPGDTIIETGSNGLVFVRGNGTYDLGKIGNQAQGISTLRSDGTGSLVTLVGNNNANGNLIVGTNVAGGKNSLVAGNGSYTATLIANSTGKNTLIGNTGIDSIVAGAGSDFISISSATALARDTVSAGLGTDTLALGAGSATDAAFKYVSGTEVLSLASSSYVTLGGYAQSLAGISTVIAGSGPDRINAAAYTSSLTIDASTDVLNADTLIGAGTASTTFVIGSATALGLSTVTGGNKIDTLVVQGGNVTNSSLAHVSNVEFLSLQSGLSTVTLDTAANAAGISTVTGGSGAYQNVAGSFYLQGSGGPSSFTLGSASYLTNDTITGGSGASTLQFASAANLAANALLNVHKIGTLKLNSPSAVILDAAAQQAGIQTVIGGTGNDTFTQLATNSTALSLDGSAGKGDSFSLSAIGNSTIQGGAGIDSLILTSAATALNGTNLSNVHSVEYLGLTSNTAITLDSGVAGAGVSTVVGGAGNDSFTDDGSAITPFYLNGSAATSDLFTVTNETRIGTGKDTITGSIGQDTLAFSSANANITDTSFKTVSSVEVVKLTSNSSIALSSYAQAAHIATVIGGAGSDTFDASSFSGPLFLDGSQGTGGLFQINAGLFGLGNDSISGGTGPDTLALTTATPSVSDGSFANVTSVEVLQLTSPTSITMGTNAAGSGISTVITGSGSDTIDASSYTPSLTNLLTIDARADVSSGDLLKGSNNVANKFLFSAPGALTNSTVTGGSSIFADTLTISAQANLSDTTFRHVTGVEVLSLTSASAVTLNAFGSTSGISTIIGGIGSDSISQGTNDNLGLSVDLSAGTGGLLAVSTASQLGNDTFAGSSGTDTLSLTGADVGVSDDSFLHIKSAEVLQLTSSSAVTLGSAAQTAGIVSVYGGSGGDRFTQSATNTPYSLTLAAAAGSNLFSLDNGGQLALDSLIGGNGVDTLAIGNGAVLSDNLFNQVTGIEVLSLSGSSAATLGTAAQANFSTIIGGTGNTTLYQDSNNTAALRLDGTSGSSNYIALTASQLKGNTDTVIGGAGTDTLALTTADTTITDGAFQGVTLMEVLSLTSDALTPSAVTLGSFAQSSGIRTVIGGTGNDTFTRDTHFSGNLVLDGSYGSGDQFNVDVNQLSSTTAIGGSSNQDQLVVSGDGFVNLSTLAGNISNIPLIQLTGQTGITLGSGVSGISTIVTANAADTVDASGLSAPITIDATALDNPNTQTIAGGQSLTGSSSYGTDFLLSSTTALRNSTLKGGGSIDTLTFSTGLSLNDDDFQNLSSSSIEILGVTGNSSVTLGSFASAAGISTLIGDNGNNLFDVSDDPTAVYIDGTQGTGNSYVIDSTKLLATGGETIMGGSGNTDRLTLVTPDTSITDDRFTQITNVGTLILPDASAVTLGSAMQTAGIATVIGADGGDTFTQKTTFTHSAYLQGGNGNNLFSISTTAQLASDSIIGGSGSDTLQLSQGGIIGDSTFAGVSEIEVLSLASGSNVTLGTATSTDLAVVIGGGETNSFTQTADNRQALLIDASAGTSNVFNLTSVQLQNGDGSGNFDTLIGKGADTLNITTPNNQGGLDVTDSAFDNLSGISVLGLTSPIAVTLGSQAQYTGISSVIGGSGSDSITIDPSYTGNITLDGSRGSGDLFAFTSSTQLTGTSSSVKGGSGSDTLSITGADTAVSDNLFTHLNNVEVLSIAGSSAVTLDGNASSEHLNRVVTSSDGSDTVAASTFSASLTIDASADTNSGLNLLLGGYAGNSFLVANGSVLPNDTVTGGSGIDTLTITNPDAGLDLNSFQHVTGIEALSLTGSSAITVGSDFGDIALASIYGGTGSSTFTDNGYTTGLQINASNGSGSNFNVLTSSRLGLGLNRDTLTGSSFHSDTLTINSSDTGITDNTFNNITSVENLVIGGSATSAVGYSKAVLGSIAGTAGISTVLLNGGHDTLVQNSANTTALVIDGSAGTANWYEIASSVKLGAGLDTIRGSGSTDTLAIATQETISDKSFAQISGVGIVSLTGASTVNLGTNAATAGFSTITGGASASTGTTFIQTQDFGGGVSLVGNSGNDTFRLSDASFLRTTGGDSLYADGGTDALQITTATTAINDNSFSNVLGVDILSLTGASQAFLGSKVNTDGLATVYGGLGNSTLKQQATFTNGLTLVGGSGNYNDLFTLDKESYLSGGKDSIIGNGGIDTLVLTEETTYADSDFQYLKGIKALSLTGASSVILDSNAKSVSGTANFATIYGGSGISTFTQNAGANQLLTLVGGGSNDSFNIVSTLLPTDSIFGGAGNDTLRITNTGTLVDASFAKVSSIEALSLAGASSVTLDLNARKTGIATVYGGLGNSTISQQSNETNALIIVGGNGSYNDSITIANTNQLANDSIVGGLGTDTLAITTAATINNGFAKVSGLEVLNVSLSGLNNSITLGATGQTAGIRTLLGGAGNDTFDASAYTTGVTLDGGTGTNVLTGGSVNDLLISQALTGTFSGGTNGTDTLQIRGQVSANNNFTNLTSIEVLDVSSSGLNNSITLGATGQTAGIRTLLGGAGNDTFDASAYSTGAGVLLNGGDGNNSLIGGSGANLLLSGAGSDTLNGGAGNDTLQAWSNASTNSASDTLYGGTGSDLFVLGTAAGNAYGKGSATIVATIGDFVAGAGNDTIQLHDFGSGHAGSAGYQTLDRGSGIIDIYTYNSTTDADHVAHLTGVTGSFDWTKNASFV